MSAEWSLTFDAQDPVAQARFWGSALGYEGAPPPQGFSSWDQWFDRFDISAEERNEGANLVDPDGARPGLGFLKVPEGKTAKNRLHLDIDVSGGRRVSADKRRERILEVVKRLQGAGARVLSEVDIDEGLDHIVMTDPEGNEFCVV
jgi:hypothetical protein